MRRRVTRHVVAPGCRAPSTAVPGIARRLLSPLSPLLVQTPLAFWERIKAGKMGDLQAKRGGHHAAQSNARCWRGAARSLRLWQRGAAVHNPTPCRSSALAQMPACLVGGASP